MRAMFLAHPADGHSLAPALATSRSLDPTPQVDVSGLCYLYTRLQPCPENCDPS
jgi:hypothetical protein